MKFIKRISYNLPNHAHFLTFSCFQSQKLLVGDDVLDILVNSWDRARQKGEFLIWAYVIMPEHVHLLIYPKNPAYEMAKIFRLLKEQFTHRIVEHWRNTSPHLLENIKVRRGKRTLHRFWQEGGGYDRNLFVWDKIGRAIDYIEWNPVRRGLISDPMNWIWSSARSRAGIKDVPLIVDDILEKDQF